MNWYLSVLKKYVVFDGRARRSEYWYFVLFNMLISLGLGIVDKALGTTSDSGTGALGGLYSLAVLLPSLGVAIRRMHDVGKSGWFLLIPIYNLILACTAGDEGPNEYGPDPKSNYEDQIDEIGRN
jgi:uncharacterized membrane protein YhaH (DUF805 family)